MENYTENTNTSTTNSYKQQATENDIQNGMQVHNLKHYICEVGNELMAKTNAVHGLFVQLKPRSAIVYCSNKSEAEVTEKIIRRKGVNARRATSDLSDTQVSTILDRLRSGAIPVLVAPEFLRPSLSKSGIQLIINHALPENGDEYLKYLTQLSPDTSVVSISGVKDFGHFHVLKKSLEKMVEFQDITIGDIGNGNVADTVTTCALETVGENTAVEVKDSDTAVAEKFLGKFGVTNAASGLVTVLAKINSVLTEHCAKSTGVPDKIISLEEELREFDSSLPEDEDDSRGNVDFNNDSRGYRGRRSSDSSYRGGGRRDRNFSGRDDNSRGRGNRRDGRRENRRDDRYGSKYSGERSGERSGDRRGGRGHESRGGRRPYGSNEEFPSRGGNGGNYGGNIDHRRGNFREHDNEGFDSRLYIGQGTLSGLTENEFKQLATSIGEIDAGQIIRVKLRDNYGFIDVKSDAATTLVNNLNGIEYNGNILPVRITGRVKTEE